MDRKSFFKQGLAKILKSADEVKKSIKEVSHEPPVRPKQEDSNFQVQEFTKPKQIKRNLTFPPGASEKKGVYEKKCTGCGNCISACPYNVIFPVYNSKLNKNITYIDTNANACLMCKDWPCIKSCDHDALKPFKKKQNPKFGQAKSIFERCTNSKEENIFCNECQTSCPVENVITFQKSGKPSFSKNCTGCGICVSVCPVFPKAILIK